MAYSMEWLRFRKAEDNFFTCRYHFGQQEQEIVVNDLQQALTSPIERDTALRYLQLFSLPAASLATLLYEVVDTAIDSTHLTSIGLAREVLRHYKDEPSIKSAVLSLAANYFVANDEWHYRRIAEHYETLNYQEELAEFLRICRANDNLEIREIGDDF